MLNHNIAETYQPACGQEKNADTSYESISSRRTQWFFTPVLAAMLQSRRLIRILTGLGMIQVFAAGMGLGGWQCPIRFALDVTCPGCGLTTAITILLKGDWTAAVRMHAFAPLMMILLILMAVVSILPFKYQHKVSIGIAALERRTGIIAIGLISMVVYWAMRILATN